MKAEKPEYVGYFAPNDPNPLIVVREDHSSLAHTHLRTEMNDFSNLVILPLTDFGYTASTSVKKAIAVSLNADAEPGSGADAVNDLHQKAVRYDETMKIQDQMVKEQVHAEAIENAAPEDKAAVKKAIEKTSDKK